MPKLLPTSLIGEAMLSQNQNGQTFYYQVTFTVFGEVLSIDDDLSDLPLIAQKLMLGNQQEIVSEKLQRGLDNLQYLIPLIALGEFKKLPSWLMPIPKEIKRLQRNIPPEIKKNPTEYIEASWLKPLVNLDSCSEIYNRFISTYFVNLMLEKDINVNLHYLPNLGYTINTDYLIQEAESSWGNSELYNTKIQQLSKTCNNIGYKALVAIIFDTTYAIEGRISAIKALGKLSYENARFPLTTALSDKNHWIRVYAVKELANFIDKKVIANTLLHIYKHDDNAWVRVRAIQALGFIKDDTLLMDTLAEEIKNLDNEEIIFHTVEALKRMDCQYSRNLLRNHYY